MISMRVMPPIIAFTLILGGIATPVDVAAKEPNSKAKRFEKLGKKAYGKKDWDEAIAAFEAAYGADPVPKFLYNIARAYEKKTDHRKAIEYLERYLEKVTDPKEREDASDRLSILQIKLRKTRSPVKIVAPEGAVVTAKGSEETAQAAGTLSTWLPFGAYEVTVSLKGFEEDTRTVVVSADEKTELKITLEKIPETKPPPPPPVVKKDQKPEPKVGAPKPPVDKKPPPAEVVKKVPPPEKEPPPPPEEPRDEAGGPPKWMAYAALGVGGLLLGGGVVAGVFSNQANDNIVELQKRSEQGKFVQYKELEEQSDARNDNANAANVLFGVGGAAVVTGAVLWFLAPADASAVPFVTPLPGGIGVTWATSL